jgi:hypothetical protein
METEHQNQTGESETTQTLTQPGPLDIIRTETVLSKLPIHNLSKKGRVNIQILKTTPDGRVELRWEVSYSDRYGQARALAYKLDTIVIDQRVEEAGKPLPERIRLGSLNEICKDLGVPEGGSNIKVIKRAFMQNAFAGINAKLKYRANDGSEHTFEAGFTRYTVIFTGQKFSDGRRADAVYIELHPRYREVLNNAPMRPLDLAYKKQLPPAAQRFYEIVSYKIFTAIKYNQPAKLSYSEYCTFSAQQRYLTRAQAQKQMYKIHEVHKKSGYISGVRYEETVDELGQLDWIMRYTPGPKAIAEYATFSGKRSRVIDAAATAALPAGAGESAATTHRPRQRRLKLTAAAEPSSSPTIIDYRLVSELGKRGVGEIDARQLLASLPPAQPVLDQLEWGDVQIEQARGKITNPPGFYISLLQRNIPLPATFESSSAREARQKAEFKQQQALQQQTETAQAAEDAARRQADEQLAALAPEAHQALLEQAKAEIFKQHPFMAQQKNASAIHEGAIRARMRAIITTGWKFQLPPAEPAAPQPEQGSVSAAVLDLQAILTTPQLPPPMEQPRQVSPAPATASKVDDHLL